jgi:hypothetical protein
MAEDLGRDGQEWNGESLLRLLKAPPDELTEAEREFVGEFRHRAIMLGVVQRGGVGGVG